MPTRSGYGKISIVASHSKLNEVRANEGKPVDESEFDKLPDVIHPLVRTHPISGDKFLYFSADRASKPLDMGESELTTLLRSLLAKVTRQGKHLLPQMASEGPRDLGQSRPAAHRDRPTKRTNTAGFAIA